MVKCFKIIVNEIIGMVFDILLIYIVTNLFIPWKKTVLNDWLFCFCFVTLIVSVHHRDGIVRIIIITSTNNCGALLTSFITLKVQECLTFTSSGRS